MRSVSVEAYVTSPEEALTATLAGATRLELCRDLQTGGLSPSAELLRAVRAETELPIFAMVRPRAGSFCMTGAEVSTMLQEIDALITPDDGGPSVDGLVFGVLDRSNRPDLPVVTELIAAARSVSSNLPITFHRAFDLVSDPLQCLGQLREAGISRVLTSGCANTAWEGRDVLRQLVDAADDGISIIGAGTVRGDHVRDLVDYTGLREVHARASAIPGVVEGMG